MIQLTKNKYIINLVEHNNEILKTKLIKLNAKICNQSTTKIKLLCG
jgi:hypothetical protein